MAKVFLTNKAVEDLSSIWNYTYDEWSEEQADKYYDFIISCCDELAENTKLGKPYDNIVQNVLGYRASHHVIFYHILKPNQIEVVRILHGTMYLKSRMLE